MRWVKRMYNFIVREYQYRKKLRKDKKDDPFIYF
jgi:hypothetical protein